MAGGDEWIRRACLLPPASDAYRFPIWRFATACSGDAGDGGGDQPALHGHPFPPGILIEHSAEATASILAAAIFVAATADRIVSAKTRKASAVEQIAPTAELRVAATDRKVPTIRQKGSAAELSYFGDAQKSPDREARSLGAAAQHSGAGQKSLNSGTKSADPDLVRSGDEQNSPDRRAKSASDEALKSIDEAQRAVIVAIRLANERYAQREWQWQSGHFVEDWHSMTCSLHPPEASPCTRRTHQPAQHHLRPRTLHRSRA